MAYIIADIGSNFITIQDAYLSIEKAKESGADMAKFQLFSQFDLYGEGSAHREIEKWLPHLRQCCIDNGIDFGCTAFSPIGAEAVDPYVNCHKVASSCVTHIPLLETIAKFRKPVIMSIGACNDEEVDEALTVLHGMPVSLLYCQASYPSRSYDCFEIENIRRRFGSQYIVGYSDHTTDILGAPYHAVKQAHAPILEKHFTAFPLLESPDRPHSLTPQEFRTMVNAINGVQDLRVLEERQFYQNAKVRKTERGYFRVRKP
jgi:N-acetylneuraminate synthase